MTEALRAQLMGNHLTVEKFDGTDGVTWDELQAVKNEMLGPEAACVEVYPPESELVNDVNRRHLWVIDWESWNHNLRR